MVGSGVERGTPHRLRTARPGRGRRGRVPRRRERGQGRWGEEVGRERRGG